MSDLPQGGVSAGSVYGNVQVGITLSEGAMRVLLKHLDVLMDRYEQRKALQAFLEKAGLPQRVTRP